MIYVSLAPCCASLKTFFVASAGPVQSKELSFSSDISLHDLDTKLRQVVSWLEKNNHVRLTIRARTVAGTPLVWTQNMHLHFFFCDSVHFSIAH